MRIFNQKKGTIKYLTILPLLPEPNVAVWFEEPKDESEYDHLFLVMRKYILNQTICGQH